jgi:hypothetical protein
LASAGVGRLAQTFGAPYAIRGFCAILPYPHEVVHAPFFRGVRYGIWLPGVYC